MPLHSLNVLGLFCPLPVLFSLREMRRLPSGDVLEVIGNDPAMLEDFPIWCQRSGHRLLDLSEDEGVIRVLIEKSSGPSAGPLPTDLTPPAPGPSSSSPVSSHPSPSASSPSSPAVPPRHPEPLDNPSSRPRRPRRRP